MRSNGPLHQVSESAFLIWKLRCTRIIELGENEVLWPSKQEIHNWWIHAISRHLALDQAMTNTRYGKKALNKFLVLHTWSGVLKDEASLPEDWIRQPGVLVGIVPLEQPHGKTILLNRCSCDERATESHTVCHWMTVVHKTCISSVVELVLINTNTSWCSGLTKLVALRHMLLQKKK
jgi:hypothetical protein